MGFAALNPPTRCPDAWIINIAVWSSYVGVARDLIRVSLIVNPDHIRHLMLEPKILVAMAFSPTVRPR